MARPLRQIKIFFFLIICTFFTYIFFSLSSLKSNSKFNSRELDKRLAALQRVVEFMVHRPEQMNVDATFTIMLTQVNEYMNEPGPYIRPIFWKKDFLKQATPRKVNYNYETVSNLIFHGRPSANESNDCIFNTLIKVPRGNCKISDECEDLLLDDDNPQGYRTTHRLLLVWIAKTFYCKESKKISYDKLIAQYCSKTLQNLVSLKDTKFHLPIKDLIIEEVVFCGTQGFLEFTTDDLFNLILSWQRPEGCFDSSFEEKQHRIRRKRNEDTIDFKCTNHATGLGAASIALFIRRYIENSVFD